MGILVRIRNRFFRARVGGGSLSESHQAGWACRQEGARRGSFEITRWTTADAGLKAKTS